jgi:HB1, ASXL, restriction endonuclease HTH domain/Restriction endonuclease
MAITIRHFSSELLRAMTFVEAAIEVLKREGKPLAVKRLAELAVKHNLLSVVGRDPEGTMEARLADAVEGHRDLLAVRPGVYGLKAYPGSRASEPASVPAEAASEEAAPAAPGGEGAGKRRRRGRRGRGKGEAAKAPDEKEEKAAEPAAEAEEPAAKEAKPEAEKSEGEGEGGKRRRRSRRGGRGRRRSGAKDAAPEAADEEVKEEAAPEPPAAPEEQPVEETPVAAEPREAPPEAELIDDLSEGEGELLEEDDVDLPSGPLLAPTHGAEELTRTDEERVVRAEIHGKREERGRHRRDRGRRRDGREQGREHGREQSREQSREHGREHGHAAPHAQPQTSASAPAQSQAAAPPPGRRPVLDVVLDLLRQSDGRPIHARHLTDLAIKKQLLDGQPNELLRQVRAALVREVREREAEGLRARVRSLGGGHFALIDKKLDPELAQAERELAASAARQRESTRVTLRRRLGRMAPAAFETLGRALLDKLGVTAVELVRRGEGVAYFGGLRQLGAGTLKTLVALRPGEAEINRRAVGELRAGLAARGYDEGLILAGGRLGADGAAELKNGSGVVLHDGSSLATLLVKHGLGVKRQYLPVDYLDVEFLSELTEG